MLKIKPFFICIPEINKSVRLNSNIRKLDEQKTGVRSRNSTLMTQMKLIFADFLNAKAESDRKGRNCV